MNIWLQKNIRRLIIIVASSLVFISILVLIFGIIQSQKLQDEIAIKQLDPLVEKINTEVRTLYKELETSLTVASKMIKAGSFTEKNVM